MYLFNPDNDLALANFSTNYTPPASALKIAADLAMLPLWFAPDGSKIIAEEKFNHGFLSSVKKIFPIQSTLISFSDILEYQNIESIISWGWNPALRKKLLDVGVREENLPSMDDLKQLKKYSSRQNAVQMLSELRNDFCGESYFLNNIDELLDYLTDSKIDSVLKMPNSGSGKGLVWIKGKITDKQTDWANRVIREQGGVIAEPVLNKVRDFAMEFYLKNGKAIFSGYSLFKSAVSGAYIGNFLLSDNEIENQLSKYISIDTLHWIRAFYLKKLVEYFPKYSGYIGVDMMICKAFNEFCVQPCVEMNLRMNMGMVARIFYDRFVDTDSSGKFVVDFFKKNEKALEHHKENQRNYPLVVENDKIKSGYLNLTPVSPETNYVAYVVIEHK